MGRASDQHSVTYFSSSFDRRQIIALIKSDGNGGANRATQITMRVIDEAWER
jgi:hypothetical protein